MSKIIGDGLCVGVISYMPRETGECRNCRKSKGWNNLTYFLLNVMLHVANLYRSLWLHVSFYSLFTLLNRVVKSVTNQNFIPARPFVREATRVFSLSTPTTISPPPWGCLRTISRASSRFEHHRYLFDSPKKLVNDAWYCGRFGFIVNSDCRHGQCYRLRPSRALAHHIDW